MFYEPKNDDHGLPHSPFKSSTVPRVIGWISTKNEDGTDNIAPYSQFTNLTYDPPMVIFSANQHPVTGGPKTTVQNIERTGEFVYNLVPGDLAEEMNKSSIAMLPDGVKDKFEYSGLEREQANLVDVAMVKGAPIKYEIKYMQTTHLPANGKIAPIDVIFGEVIGVHVDDKFIMDDGKIDIVGIQPVARLGYYDFTKVNNSFEMKPPQIDPKYQELVDKGLEGKV
ncbi:flavin reductase family protein [Aerococcus kribbianus]|uniref:Flavin reductase family protein n=1 Tax=Aerococcus kribbianus TaxID=2999064 RepID=A0A9X3FPF9_9LACT|nr:MULTISPECIES: flavin reductase family protein [unclassified Aerococcus]MCZ0717563.1 flavin reductase family protein [Aerococcus sp. YH-aer221]MCZ0725851.1 flavin reductase family protein [Aerococcus sp. YH-aer222]